MYQITIYALLWDISVWLQVDIVAVICKACSVISASCGIVMHLHGWSRFGWPVQLVFARYFSGYICLIYQRCAVLHILIDLGKQ
jgi:hypothetical protein